MNLSFRYGAIAIIALLSTVTLSSCGGSNSTSSQPDKLSVAAPSNLRYLNVAANYALDVPIAPAVPRSDGDTIIGYSVTPALPAGLILDTRTGVITGKPTSASEKTSYTITAKNNGGSTSTLLSIATRAMSADSYVVGKEATLGLKNWVATVWKNGVATHLANEGHNSDAYAVAVVGSDVFVLGDDQGAVVWKNGVANRLAAPSDFHPGSLAVQGNDIYVSGIVGGDVSTSGASQVATVVLKNGIVLFTIEKFRLKGMAILDGDVYMAGTNDSGAALWKNGVATAISTGGKYESATSVGLYGNDVYVGGDIAGNGTVWKNGAVIPSVETKNCSAQSLAISGPDIYLACSHDLLGLNFVARLAKNGVDMPVSDERHLSNPATVAAAGDDVFMAFNEAVKALSEGDIFDVWAGKIWHNGAVIDLGPNTEVHDLAIGWH